MPAYVRSAIGRMEWRRASYGREEFPAGSCSATEERLANSPRSPSHHPPVEYRRFRFCPIGRFRFCQPLP